MMNEFDFNSPLLQIRESKYVLDPNTLTLLNSPAPFTKAFSLETKRSSNSDKMFFTVLSSELGIIYTRVFDWSEQSYTPWDHQNLNLLSYKGTWNALTNTPLLTNPVGSNGDYYITSKGGSVDFGNGFILFVNQDVCAHNGVMWENLGNVIGVEDILSADESMTISKTGNMVDISVYFDSSRSNLIAFDPNLVIQYYATDIIIDISQMVLKRQYKLCSNGVSNITAINGTWRGFSIQGSPTSQLLQEQESLTFTRDSTLTVQIT